MRYQFLALLAWCSLLVFNTQAAGKKDNEDNKVIKFDDTRPVKWNEAFNQVSITSSSDGKAQKAMVYISKSKTPKPLIVSLHTWSGDYTQKDPLCKEIVARDWNYIHPNFRGANRTPDAMGSPLVISDIEDAIKFALAHTNSDPDDVHIVGVSGGGYATLLSYMNVKYPVKSFSAWAPISDIEAWYWESVGRKQKYAKDILKSLGNDGNFSHEEARKRSPLFHKLPKELRKDSKLLIYEGVHDGYKGSVPITHAINMYNRVVGELKYGEATLDAIMPHATSDSVLVSEKEIINLVTKRYNPYFDKKQLLFDRNIYLYRKFQNVELTIFEGGHEQIEQALGLIPVKFKSDLKLNILTIGDSNGQIKHGWVTQLKKRLPNSTFVNISQSGRTIGFDNNGKEKLNALRNIQGYLNTAMEKSDGQRFDYIIICLGTNDTKSIFADRQAEVSENFKKLLDSVNAHAISKRKTKLIYVTPPPMRIKNMAEKYQGGNERLAQLMPTLTQIATEKGFKVVDVFHPLQGILDYYASDGVHMAAEGQAIVADKILEELED